MLDINHILVVLDQEHPEQYALDRAVWLAKATNSDLTLMTCAWDTYGDDNARIDEATRHSIKGALSQRAQSWLDSLLEDRDVANVTVRTEVHWQKHLHDGAIESIRNTDFDLVIKGTQPHTLLQRIFTHTDWNLMRHCPAPVMLVKSATPWKHNRVLAAIDSTSRDTGHELINDNILSFAEHLADHFETDLHLANAYPMVAVAFAMVPEVTAPDDIQRYITEQHEEGCAAWAKKFNIADDHIHIGEGDTDAVIADIAKETEADLVVVGTIGRGGLSGVLIGNTAEALVDKLECDILVIKPQDGVRPDIS